MGIHWLKYATYMKMFRMDHRIRKSLMEFAKGCQNPLIINTWDRDNIISPNHMYMFDIKECNKTNDTFIWHHKHAKFKMAAMK